MNHLLHGTALWVYLVVLGGLYRLGREPLKKDPLHRDRLMGVRPMGSLSLSISAAYFGTLTLMVPLAFINPVTVAYSALLAVLVVLGIVLFFLPLHSIHRQMLAEKRREQESISRRAIQAAAASAEVPAVPHQATLADLRNLLADLRDIMAIEMAERRVAGINTWPFDTAILRRLAVIAIPVTAAVTSNLLIKVVLRL